MGCVAVLGDHDECYGAHAITAALRDAGITVLVNEAATLAFQGGTISVIGVTRDAARVGDLLTQAPTDSLKLVLAHDPAAFALLPEGITCLMLCGHTHGGQIRIPLLGPVINMSDAPLRWTYGHVVIDNRHLYVTSGIGTSLLPVRIGVPPEIALIELDGAEALQMPRFPSR